MVVECRMEEPTSDNGPATMTLTFDVGTTLDQVEVAVILSVLEKVGGDKKECARLLGVATRTIYRRLEELREKVVP